MSDNVKPGDSVEWSSSGGKSVGRVKEKLTKPMEIKGHHVAASPENPEFLVASNDGGAEAAHKPSSLKKFTAKSGSADKRASAKTPAQKKAAPAKETASKRKAAATARKR